MLITFYIKETSLLKQLTSMSHITRITLFISPLRCLVAKLLKHILIGEYGV